MKDFDQSLHARLADLDAAVPGGTTPIHARRSVAAASSHVRSKLPWNMVLVVMIVVGGLAAVTYVARQAPQSGPGSSLAAASAALGSDGLPLQIGTDPVFRINDHATWQDSAGSFLLLVRPSPPTVACLAHAQGTAEADLLANACGGWSLGSFIDASGQQTELYAAPKSSPASLLRDWADRSIVVRVHTHDSESSQCRASEESLCTAAVVIEAIVWTSGSSAPGSPQVPFPTGTPG